MSRSIGRVSAIGEGGEDHAPYLFKECSSLPVQSRRANRLGDFLVSQFGIVGCLSDFALSDLGHARTPADSKRAGYNGDLYDHKEYGCSYRDGGC